MIFQAKTQAKGFPIGFRPWHNVSNDEKSQECQARECKHVVSPKRMNCTQQGHGGIAEREHEREGGCPHPTHVDMYQLQEVHLETLTKL